MEKYSSLRGALYTELLANRLDRAVSYDRIAGYFSSSILELAGEAIERMPGKTRIICNSDVDSADIKVADLAERAQHEEWCAFKPEDIPDAQERFRKLYQLLTSGKLEVRVLAKDKFGLVHGKAGVIMFRDGSKTSFLGSANETISGWINNYELVWEDNNPETVKWVQDEFDTLWNHPLAMKLSKLVITDIDRLSKRTVYPSIKQWREDNDVDKAASAAVESPIYRNSLGLWNHQKYFVELAMKQHATRGGARLINADQVGLGKTIQLATSAMLMELIDDKPVLAIVPKTLQKQWRDDMMDLLGIPSAYWVGSGWIDETDHYYPLEINECPRRIGIISQGIIVNGSEKCEKQRREILNISGGYSCVIVDEAHRARRRNIREDQNGYAPDKNKLYSFLCEISAKTHSMLLATATPIQLNAVEAWDLLNILSYGSDSVLGTNRAKWHQTSNVPTALRIVEGVIEINDCSERWDWIKNPLPLSNHRIKRKKEEGRLGNAETYSELYYSNLPSDCKRIVEDQGTEILEHYNPFIEHIVRRTRSYLEDRGMLQKIEMVLLGESKEESIVLEGYLKSAYQLAEEFCKLIAGRCRGAGLFKTQLLRRVGSSVIAGYKTGKKMLESRSILESDDEDDDDDIEENTAQRLSGESSSLMALTDKEHDLLTLFVDNLERAEVEDGDPKLNKIFNLLDQGALDNGIRTVPWKDLGCILFSQYLDTAAWVAEKLSIHYSNEVIGLYAGGSSSKIYLNGFPERIEKNDLKKKVTNKEIRLLVGTDAASEGLNLQKLGSLINIDLPWNPTRLEQRKGRIQRIGQVNEKVYVFNMKYRDSVEERVHEMLSDRLQTIHSIFGQIPDTLKDVWIDIAEGNIEEARNKIGAVPERNPFKNKYNQTVENVNWETCTKVLKMNDVIKELSKGW